MISAVMPLSALCRKRCSIITRLRQLKIVSDPFAALLGRGQGEQTILRVLGSDLSF